MLLLVAAAVRRFLPRPSTSGNTTTLRTIYDGANAWADFGNTNVLQNRYMFTRAIDEVLARLSNTSILAWDLPDLLGSVRDISDGAGTAVLDHVKYDSYGNILNETAPSAGDRFKYTAREWDTATSQYFYRARYYNSGAGRFSGQDPLKFDAGEPNASCYVENRPTIGKDPTGNDILLIPQPVGIGGLAPFNHVTIVVVDPVTGRILTVIDGSGPNVGIDPDGNPKGGIDPESGRPQPSMYIPGPGKILTIKKPLPPGTITIKPKPGRDSYDQVIALGVAFRTLRQVPYNVWNHNSNTYARRLLVIADADTNLVPPNAIGWNEHKKIYGEVWDEHGNDKKKK